MRWLLVCVSLLCALSLLAKAQAQPPQAVASGLTYQVRLRFKIEAELQQRYAYYKQMIARLEAAGFKAAPGRPREELYGDSLAGTLPASGIGTLRLERFLRTAILVPAGYALPTDAEKTVLVRFDLAITGLDRQRELESLARQQLKTLGLIENVGYDNQGHTRILGRLPVPAFDVLLKDSMETAIPSSLKTNTSILNKAPLVRLAIVIAEPSPPPPDVALPAGPPPGKEYLEKISPDLKAFLAKVPEADLEKHMRIELVLRGSHLTETLQAQLHRSEAMFITEGSFGPIVTGLTSPSRLTVLAQQPEISTVRLPQAPPGFIKSQESGVAFIRFGRDLGTGPFITPVGYEVPLPKRLVILGDDFRGYQSSIGAGLPRNTRFIDATAELTSDLRPMPGMDAAGVGMSTTLALEFLRSNPHNDVILVRINPTSPYQIQQVGQAILGNPWATPSFTTRKEEWNDAGSRIEATKLDLRIERRRVQSDFALDDATKARREEYRKKQVALDAAEKAHYEQGLRFNAFSNDMRSLKGAAAVAVMLQWNPGYADLPGSPPHLRFVSTEALRSSAWYQAVALRPGQVWTGLFRDFDGDNIMEWTTNQHVSRPDLAFLSWRAFGASAVSQQMLPENAVVEVILNWFEVHAPGTDDGDVYRKPMANLHINVLKQRDPTGKVLPPDVFEVVARTPFTADRVENGQRGAHYQSIVRFTVPAGGGRYALQVTGAVPGTTGGIASGEKGEIHPKITLSVVDPAKRAAGRIVYESVATPE